MNQKLEILKKVFEDFERGIDILESFESELKHLDTYGFREEVKEIKIRLKDTAQIQFIESKLKELKEKIDKRDKSEKEERQRKRRDTFLKWWEEGKKERDKLKLEREKLKEKLTKEQINKIEEKVEESSHKHAFVEDVLKELDEGIKAKQEPKIKEELTKKQVEAIETKVEQSIKHRLPTISELVQQTKERFAKPEIKEAIPSTKEKIISSLKEKIELKEEPKGIASDMKRLEEHGFIVKKPISDLKIEQTIPRHYIHSKQNIITHLKEVHKYV